ncbi:hypothetical protein NEOLEDRAFT_1141785 [Neolentinus lepideus HHB14362 ss-1]|uniref:Uncharacterized protein n=1 Tax=Neolentinus lepideus HHB14362 ss-1 TaxID=1314782 RepID=A0A165NHJ6_9AGAM|nr:hypothetical protein NEOLEDRAFT_1141785 [Neolentinus lepideus HHB14362 ss-1]
MKMLKNNARLEGIYLQIMQQVVWGRYYSVMMSSGGKSLDDGLRNSASAVLWQCRWVCRWGTGLKRAEARDRLTALIRLLKLLGRGSLNGMLYHEIRINLRSSLPLVSTAFTNLLGHQDRQRSPLPAKEEKALVTWRRGLLSKLSAGKEKAQVGGRITKPGGRSSWRRGANNFLSVR